MAPDNNPPLLLDVQEAGHSLNVGRTTVYKLVESGELVRVKIGKRSLITAASVAAYVDRLAGETAWRMSRLPPDRGQAVLQGPNLRANGGESRDEAGERLGG